MLGTHIVTTVESKSGDDNLNALANELLLQIAHYLNLPDKLKFRLILSKKHKSLLLPLLKPSLSRIYVSPTGDSVSRFTELCKSSFFGPHITEVVFIPCHLGNDQEEVDDLKDYIRLCEPGTRRRDVPRKSETGWLKMAERSFALYKQLVAKHQPIIEQSFCGGSGIDDDADEAFKINIASGLSHLQHVTAIRVQEKIDREGLNACALWYDDKFASWAVSKQAHPKSTDQAVALAASTASDMRFEDGVDAFLGAVAGSHHDGFELAFGNGFGDQLPYLTQRFCGLGDMLADLMPKVDRAVVSCHDDDEYEKRLTDTWLTFVRYGSQLRSLEVNMDAGDVPCPRSWHITRRVSFLDHVIYSGLPAKWMPNLATLKIVAPSTKPNVVAAYSLLQLLRKKSTTLRKVYLSGVFLLGSPDKTTYQMSEAVQDFRSTLFKLSKDFGFETFKMILHRRDEHEIECVPYNLEGRCDRFCEQYRLDAGYYVPREELEKLAGEFEVPLENSCWDFGGFIMRQ